MRYPASEKLEIIRLVEQSHLGVGSTLDKLGIPKTTFYRWYDRFLAFGDAGLEDRNSSPGRVWNRIPDDVRGQIIDLALEETQLSPRELAVRFTDTRGYFVSEASVYRLLKAHDLITSPAFVVIKAADEFRDKTTAPNQLAGVSVAPMMAFHARSKRADLIRARKVSTACPLAIRQRMPERFMRWVTRVLLAASTTPEPMATPSAFRAW